MVKPRAALVVSLIGNDETVFVGSLHRMRLALDGLQFAGEGGDAIETGSALAVDAVEAASKAASAVVSGNAFMGIPPDHYGWRGCDRAV